MKKMARKFVCFAETPRIVEWWQDPDLYVDPLRSDMRELRFTKVGPVTNKRDGDFDKYKITITVVSEKLPTSGRKK